MSIGPVQLIVLGFRRPDFRGEILAEIERLRANDQVRVIDALGVYKDAEGAIEVEHLSTLTHEEAVELGSTVAALVGLGIEGEGATGAVADEAAELAADALERTVDDAWDVLAQIPNDTAAGLLLLEHRWAIPLRDAIARAGGFRIDDGFLDPLDLVAVGLVAADEAQALHELEAAAGA